MAENKRAEPSPPARRTFGHVAKQVGLFLLFGTMLMMPPLRRLRRRVWAWSAVRVMVAACGVWLVWRFARAGAGAVTLAGGMVTLAFSLLVRAQPETKSADALARELNALIVLNGGTFRKSPGSAPVSEARIFVLPKQIAVLGRRDERLGEIPFAKVRDIAVTPDAGAGHHPQLWKVEIHWSTEGPGTTSFLYNGVFAEHLARVTEATLRSQWKKELPIVAQ